MRALTTCFFLVSALVLLSGVDSAQSATTLAFQQAVNGYYGTQDTEVQGDEYANMSWGNNYQAVIDAPPNEDQALLRFDNIFGLGPNQILPSSYIVNATLQLCVADDAYGTAEGTTVHEMLVPWNENVTWNSMNNGISANDVEAKMAAVGRLAGPFNVGQYKTLDVTESLQAWSSGNDNYGWAFLMEDNGLKPAWSFYTSEASSVAVRPKLTVNFRGPYNYVVPVTDSPLSHLRQWVGVTTEEGASGEFIPVSANSILSGNVHVFVHGWQPGEKAKVENDSGKRIWDADVGGDQIKHKTAAILKADPTATVLVYDWLDGAATEEATEPSSPIFSDPWFVEVREFYSLAAESRRNAPQSGARLVDALDSACDLHNVNVHLVGESHGARVVTDAAVALSQDQTPVTHLTLLDSPEGVFGASNKLHFEFGKLRNDVTDGTTFIDNYHSSVVGGPYRDTYLDGYRDIVNVELCPELDPNHASDWSEDHAYASKWYVHASGYSYEDLGGEDPMPAYDGGDLAMHWSPMLGNEYQSLGENFYRQDWSGNTNGFTLQSSSGTAIGADSYAYTSLSVTEDDMVSQIGFNQIDKNGGLTLSQFDLNAQESLAIEANAPGLEGDEPSEDSNSALWSMIIELGADDDALVFDYQFLTEGDGDELGIWVDGEMVFRIVGATVGTDERSTVVPIDQFDEGSHMLTLALHGTGEADASVIIDHLQLVSIVPEPSTLVLLGIGILCILAQALRRRQ